MKSLPINRSSGPSQRGRKLSLAWSSTDGVPAMFKVAFATSDRLFVNQHFGATVGFAIHAVDAQHSRLVELVEYPAELYNNSMDRNENAVSEKAYACGAGVSWSQSKLVERISALADCAAVYCLAVGGSAVRQLLASGIQPVRLESPCAIDALLLELRRAIGAGGVAWVDKQVRRDAPDSRFERMLEEGWQE
jgi:nitrogen fixation protein NifX